MLALSLVGAGLVGLLLLVFIVEDISYGYTPIIKTILLVLCLISCISSVIVMRNISDEQEWQEDWQTDIVALKDNSNIDGKVNGGIFVTSGYIEESLYYYCMENTEQGKHMIKIPADKTYIIETNDIKPSVVKQINKYVDKRQYFWFLVTDEEKYIIYVPENTIDTTYKVDLQ